LNNVHLSISTDIFKNKIENKEIWIKFIKEKLGCDSFELSLDFFPFFIQEPFKSCQIEEFVELCDTYEIQITHTYTGNSIRNFNLLLSPNLGLRLNSLKYFETAIDITSGLDSYATGGFIGYFPLDAFGNKLLKSKNSVNKLEVINKYQEIIIDNLNYISNVAYNAGLDEFIIELVHFCDDLNKIFLFNKNIIEKLNQSSKIPINFSVFVSNKESLELIETILKNISVIRFNDLTKLADLRSFIIKNYSLISKESRNGLKIIFDYSEELTNIVSINQLFENIEQKFLNIKREI